MTPGELIAAFKDDMIKILDINVESINKNMDIKFDSVNRVIAVGAAMTSGQIDDLRNDIKEHRQSEKGLRHNKAGCQCFNKRPSSD